jgi:hypothetical protein
MRKPAARMISGKVSQNDIFSVKTINTHNRIYGTIELINCQTLLDTRGLLYFEMIDCQFWADVVDVFKVMIINIS